MAATRIEFPITGGIDLIRKIVDSARSKVEICLWNVARSLLGSDCSSKADVFAMAIVWTELSITGGIDLI